MFRTRQARTFDLKSAGQLSRYMLAMEMTSPAENLLGDGSQPSAQFYNTYLPLANITTLNVNVSIAIQADIVLMLNYTSNNFSADFGYNYWGRSCEDITLPIIESFSEKTYALKGDAQTFGFEFNTTNAVALSATESQATVHTGTNGTGPDALLNNGIDFPQLATTATVPPIPLQDKPNSTIPTDQIKTSIPPVFITYNDVNVSCSGSRGSSCKLFTNVSYTWNDNKELQPYLGLGGEVEFDHNTRYKNNKKNNDSCPSFTTSQWGIWIKTGATFN
jgi:hypothetical protein